jgi:AraC-like DNA-binding protein
MIAAELGISLRYAHQVFNRDGTTIARFIRDRRLDAAAAALRDAQAGARPGELATRYGFGSRDQLARAFRRRYGMTMREYRDAGPNRPG